MSKKQGPYHDMFAVLVGGKTANLLHERKKAFHDLASALESDPPVVSLWAQQEAAEIIECHGHRVARRLAKSLRHSVAAREQGT